MTAGSPRRRPRRAPDAALVDARLQAHHAAQLLASFAGTLLEPRDDDGHRSLCWDDTTGRLSTGSAARADAALTLHLDPATLDLELESGGDASTRRWSLDGRTWDDARDLLEAAVKAALGRAVELPPPEYDLPDHPVARGHPFRPRPPAGAELVGWFSAAAHVLEPLARRTDAGPLRCWPHHFDLATLLTVPGRDAEGRTRTVGVGMTPGDAERAAPYGYVTPWPYPWTVSRPPLVRGAWHTDGWLGAVLPASAWIGPDGPAAVAAFYAEAVEASLALHRAAG